MIAWLRRVVTAPLVDEVQALRMTILETAAELRTLRSDLDATGDALVRTRDQLVQVAQQLNRNTQVIARWATQSASLHAIEAKEASKTKRQTPPAL